MDLALGSLSCQVQLTTSPPAKCNSPHCFQLPSATHHIASSCQVQLTTSLPCPGLGQQPPNPPPKKKNCLHKAKFPLQNTFPQPPTKGPQNTVGQTHTHTHTHAHTHAHTRRVREWAWTLRPFMDRYERKETEKQKRDNQKRRGRDRCRHHPPPPFKNKRME